MTRNILHAVELGDGRRIEWWEIDCDHAGGCGVGQCTDGSDCSVPGMVMVGEGSTEGEIVLSARLVDWCESVAGTKKNTQGF